MSSRILEQRVVPPSVSWTKYGLRVIAIGYLGIMIVLPLAALVRTGISGGAAGFWSEISAPIAVASLKLTLFAASAISVINAIMGTLTAYVLVRYQFPGRRLMEAIADASFAIPTLVTGVMLVLLFGPQSMIGGFLSGHGIQIIFAKPGIIIALLFVTYPFVIRSVQPVLLELNREQEEAAHTIGASKWTTFFSVVLPTLAPATLTGCLLSFARALGEFGSIVVVAGNIPLKTLTAPVYLFGQIESENVRGASAVSIVLLALSFSLMIALDLVQKRVVKA